MKRLQEKYQAINLVNKSNLSYYNKCKTESKTFP